MRVFLGDSKNSMVALLFICWECILYESACIIGYCTYWVVGEWSVCIVVLQVCVDFGELVSCVHYANVSILSHGLVIMDWLTSDLPPFNEIISSSKILSSSSLFIYSLVFKEICACATIAHVNI